MSVAEYELDIPTRITVTGDTHLGARRDWLPLALTDRIAGSDLVIHTGDFATPGALELFQSYGRVLAVTGNNDGPELHRLLPERLRISAGSTRILVTHGHRERGRSARESVTRAYRGEADLVIFGHSHRPYWKEEDGTWFLNPGSSTMKRWEPRFSFAVVDIDERGRFAVEFVYFDEQKRPSGATPGRGHNAR